MSFEWPEVSTLPGEYRMMNLQITTRVVESILGSRKYRGICQATVEDVVDREARNHRNLAAIENAARRRLHLIWQAYLGEPDYEAARVGLSDAFRCGDDVAIRRICSDVMSAHASTRERCGELSVFYESMFSRTGRPKRILDLACAMNPFSVRWMDLPTSCVYHAYDINRRFVSAVEHYLELENMDGHVELRDVTCNPPDDEGDVALLLKIYNCMERRRHGCAWEVVSAVKTRWVAISFPGKNLNGRPRNILGNYLPHISEECEKNGWSSEVVDDTSEVIVLVKKF